MNCAQVEFLDPHTSSKVFVNFLYIFCGDKTLIKVISTASITK